MAEIVRRRSWGGVLPLGRHVSISGSRSIHAPSVSIAPSSFQEEQNARHHKQFKLEQALAATPAGESPANRGVQCCCSHIQRREGRPTRRKPGCKSPRWARETWSDPSRGASNLTGRSKREPVKPRKASPA